MTRTGGFDHDKQVAERYAAIILAFWLCVFVPGDLLAMFLFPSRGADVFAVLIVGTVFAWGLAIGIQPDSGL